MIAIIDYGAGNLCSIKNALHRLDALYEVTDSPELIARADKVILPGVGQAKIVMDCLAERNLITTIKSLKVPTLGICIGMQVMCKQSEEGNASCMGIFDTVVRRLTCSPNEVIKIPHVGWNTVAQCRNNPLFNGIDDNTFFYYVHSYAADLCEETIAVTEHGRQFSGALVKDNFYGTQFHPEKSGKEGEQLLKNFLAL